jgi:hypothetical protein
VLLNERPPELFQTERRERVSEAFKKSSTTSEGNALRKGEGGMPPIEAQGVLARPPSPISVSGWKLLGVCFQSGQQEEKSTACDASNKGR